MRTEPLASPVRDSSGDSIINELGTELQELYVNLGENRSRKLLLETLNNEGLATRDIFSFVVKQAQQKVLTRDIDQATSEQAMKAKIGDLKKYIRHIKIEIKKKEDHLRLALKGKKQTFRRAIKKMKKNASQCDEKKKQIYRKKLAHYRRKQIKKKDIVREGILKEEKVRNKIHSIVPKRFQQYRDLLIFKPPESFPIAENPLGPFVCDKSIKLSENELLVLKKDPKFSVRSQLKDEEFFVETHKALSKHRYRNSKWGKEKQSYSGELKHWLSLNNPVEEEQVDRKFKGSKEVKRIEKIDKIWEESKSKYTYNPKTKTLSFLERKPTDYKLNKYVNLPKAIDDEGEFQCEIKKRKYLQALDDFRKLRREQEQRYREKRKRKKEKDMGQSKYGQETGGERNKKRTRVAKDTKREKEPSESNLTLKEREGLKSLRNRIKEEELVIAQTDKSSRFTVLSRKQYIESGEKHTKKDKLIGWKEVKELQRHTNDHVWWLSRALRYAEDTDSTRMTQNLIDHGGEVPEMVLLFKDHKDWSPESGQPVPSRPVVSGNKGLNTHLSELLSEILEPIALHMGSAEVSSTEEALHKITNINKYIDEGKDLETLNVLRDLSMNKERECEQIQETLEDLIRTNNPNLESAEQRGAPTNDEICYSHAVSESTNERLNKISCYGTGASESNSIDARPSNIEHFETGASGVNVNKSTDALVVPM